MPLSIGVTLDDLAARTSSVPAVSLLVSLSRARPDYTFYVARRRRSRDVHDVVSRLRRSAGGQVRLLMQRGSQRLANLLNLVIPDGRPLTAQPLDVSLRFNAGPAVGPCRASIGLVADLSALERTTSSLDWKGRLLYRRALRHSERTCSAVVCISHFTRRDLEGRGLLRGHRLPVIYNAIEPRWMAPAETVGPFAGMGRPYWLWYGHITPRKNLMRLLRAYHAVESRGSGLPNMIFVAAKSRGRALVSAEVARLGLARQVHMCDALPLAALVGAVDSSVGVLLPSLHEGFGMPIIEAFARGVPVLAGNCTAMPEVAGGLATLCDPWDEASIENALAMLAAQERGPEEAIAARRSRAAQFAPEVAAAQYARLIDACIAAAHAEGRQQVPGDRQGAENASSLRASASHRARPRAVHRRPQGRG